MPSASCCLFQAETGEESLREHMKASIVEHHAEVVIGGDVHGFIKKQGYGVATGSVCRLGMSLRKASLTSAALSKE